MIHYWGGEPHVRTSKITLIVTATAALALGACGTTGSTSGSSSSSGGASCGDYKIAFFGPLTGPNANLGIYIRNGAQIALDDYNAKHADCKVTMTEFDSQGDPNQAPGLAQRAIDDKKILGIVGPTFSGESKAVDPTFNAAGLTTVTASATNPKLAENGWKTFFRVLGNDATQGPAAAKYLTDTLKSTKVFVVDDASEYGKGLAEVVRKSLGSAVVGNDGVQQKQTDFSATVTKITSSGATALYFGGYAPEAALLAKQLKTAGWTGQFVSDDGVKDPAFFDGAGTAADSVIVTCPCNPPESYPAFTAAYKKKFNTDPGTYSGEAYDAATVLLDAIGAGKNTRADVLAYVKAYDKAGVTKHIKFDENGEVKDVKVFAYKVENKTFVSAGEIK